MERPLHYLACRWEDSMADRKSKEHDCRRLESPSAVLSNIVGGNHIWLLNT